MRRMDFTTAAGVPIYGGVRRNDIEAFRKEAKLGQRMEGGVLIGNYRDYALIQRAHTKEAILWKDILLGLCKPRDLKGGE